MPIQPTAVGASPSRSLGVGGRPFWDDLDQFGDRRALVDGRTRQSVSFKELASLSVERRSNLHGAAPRLVAIEATPDIDSVAWMLGALQAGHAVCLVKPQTSSEALARFVNTFKPWRLVFCDLPVALGYDASERALQGPHRLFQSAQTAAAIVHQDLGLLLLTSGSVGPPKAVKLSRSNLTVSALQVALALGVTPDDCSLLALPLSYVYGLSVLTSHLLMGASVVLDRRSILDADCIASCKTQEITTLPGVSFTFEAISKIGWRRLDLSTVRRLTHSGDVLKAGALEWAVRGAERGDFDFFRMYGMTEASGRISVLPPDEFGDNPGSVGRAVLNGDLRLSEDGEVLFTGPNVMMGYAHDAGDLQVGDTCGGHLKTGDLGHVDASGRLTLTGRSSRLAKVLGLRVSLDEIEESLSSTGLIAALCRDDQIHLFSEVNSKSAVELELPRVATALGLHPGCFKVVAIKDAPRHEGGKLAREQLWAHVGRRV